MNEEFARARVPGVTRGMGEWLVGPSIIVWGTDEQKAHFLPRIIDGTDRYCQGFSEPDAGSDLAGLKTRGVVDGDEIVVTGQKVWTSGAHLATMMFCLCRTDPDAPKHRGISYVLVPMKRPTDPRTASTCGRSARSRATALHRDLHHRGPRAAVQRDRRAEQRLAGHDDHARQRAGRQRHHPARAVHAAVLGARREVKRLGRHDDLLVRQQLAWAYTRTEIMRFPGLRLLSEVIAKKEPGPASSINKMFWSEYARASPSSVMNLRGPRTDGATQRRGTRPIAGRATSSAAGRSRSGAAPRRSSAISSASGCSGCRRSRRPTKGARDERRRPPRPRRRA